MIELLLAAERLLSGGDLDQADRLFAQVAEADPRNAIAVTGRARVAQARGDAGSAGELARSALEIDPEDATARRLLEELNAGAPPEGMDRTRDAGPGAAEATPARRSLLARLRGFLGLGR